MLIYNIDNYTVEIANITANYDDGLYQYNAVYIGTNVRPTSAYSIRICKKDELIKLIAIGAPGGATVPYQSSVIFEVDRLVCCCGDSVFCISIPELNQMWKVKADSATCFQIFKHNQDYIVHGELDISLINRQGEIMWQQSGADIFTTPDGKGDFLVTDDYILATDWNYKKYKFDFDGNLIG